MNLIINYPPSQMEHLKNIQKIISDQLETDSNKELEKYFQAFFILEDFIKEKNYNAVMITFDKYDLKFNKIILLIQQKNKFSLSYAMLCKYLANGLS